MARRATFKTLFFLWCLLGTVLSIPTPTMLPRRLEEQRYTTTRMAKVIAELPITRTRLPLPVVNSELRTSSTTSPTTSPTMQRLPSSGDPLYRFNGSNGQACILLQVDAIITIKYRNKLGEEKDAPIYVPDDAIVSGHCDNENTATMSLRWNAFVLFWSFAKTPGNERWYVDKIELTYNSSDRHFEHVDEPKKTIRLSTGQKHKFFPTPLGKSYTCNEEVEIPLTDGKNHASLLLRDLKLQPFKFKDNNFAAEFSCKSFSARAGRDETAPVAVGSTLAAAVLLTITGYAAYRYFKVKKVKYDAME
ncbi:uncharacterized protein LOC107269857 [Cephus cinctus]|uniref:Uncharacterized protein LOC107269857 n=1 Tax=Cephus cinctus TaxID=211228 RepID=A0AAJ7C1Q2_CEPCN|nr:uncharacterized protein LOC107269857 [Cephus cinctus]